MDKSTIAPTWKTIAVRIERPREVSTGDFLATIRCWLDHHCIILADLRGKTDIFDAVFDNPRDARLFERRFGAQSTSKIPARTAARRSVSATASSFEASVGGLTPVDNAA